MTDTALPTIKITRTTRRKRAPRPVAPEPAPLPAPAAHTQAVWTRTRTSMALLYGGLEPGDKYFPETAPDWWLAQ